MSKATLAILNANVVTLDPAQPRAQAVAIKHNRIFAVGSNQETKAHVDRETEILDADGKTILPGFTDCHIHMTGFGRFLQELNLRNTTSITEMQQKLRQYADENPKKRWILGGRWDQDIFAEKRYPTRWDLDAAVNDRPVFLLRVCGHAGVANSKALQLTRITGKEEIEGGIIDRDESTGEPNGLIRENALDLICNTIPEPDPEELEDSSATACQKAVEAGMTSVHWLVDSGNEIRAIQKLNAKHKLPLRVYLGISSELLDEVVTLGLLPGFGDEKIKLGFIKAFADGSLGARTAALKEPYSDMARAEGIMVNHPAKLRTLILKAHKAGLQIAVHAIGDHAIGTTLDCFEHALKMHRRDNHRHRIEHCSVLNPRLIERIKHLKLTASVQPHFTVSDSWVTNRVGEKRARWVYPFKTLIDEGISVVSGSDCPVEPVDPLLGICAATSRKSSPEQQLTVEEAVRTYTSQAAYASFEEDSKGTVEPGKLADIIVLSEDPFSTAPENIKNIRVDLTIVDGRIVYRRQDRPKPMETSGVSGGQI